MKMPFGKHKGQEIHTIPRSYLAWMKDNITTLKGDLLGAVDAGLAGKPFEPPGTKERVDEAKWKMLVRLREREMDC